MSESPITASTLTEPIRLIRRRKAALAGVGLTEAALARRIGVSRNTVNLAVLGRNRSPRIRGAIAEAVGQPVTELFPPSLDAVGNSSATQLYKVA